jgi:hypothetical protein
MRRIPDSGTHLKLLYLLLQGLTSRKNLPAPTSGTIFGASLVGEGRVQHVFLQYLHDILSQKAGKEYLNY